MSWGAMLTQRQLLERQAALVAELEAAQAALAACRVTIDFAGVPMVGNSPESSRERVKVWAVEQRLRDTQAALRRLGGGTAGGGTVETAAVSAMPTFGGEGASG